MGAAGERTMRHPDEEPEHAGGGGTEGLLAGGLLVVIVVALALLVGPVVADDLSALEPDRLLATWAAR
jgi:hypothetical protein